MIYMCETSVPDKDKISVDKSSDEDSSGDMKNGMYSSLLSVVLVYI